MYKYLLMLLFAGGCSFTLQIDNEFAAQRESDNSTIEESEGQEATTKNTPVVTIPTNVETPL